MQIFQEHLFLWLGKPSCLFGHVKDFSVSALEANMSPVQMEGEKS